MGKGNFKWDFKAEDLFYSSKTINGGIIMKEKIIKVIENFPLKYAQDKDLKTGFRKPLIKFADAEDPIFNKLKEAAGSQHALPAELLPDAATVISYFIPLSKDVVNSNIEGRMSSREWAQAYLDLNELIGELDRYLKKEIEDMGYKAVIIPTRIDFDKNTFKNYWSHRHAAYAAGLGKFGLNNMLITEQGCCGRFASLVTNLKIEPSERQEKEYCLYKAGEDCRECVDRCVNGSLQVDKFDAEKCYQMLIYNDLYHSDLLKATEVCGKCCVGIPCSLTDPTIGRNYCGR